jgi:Zn-dependent protease
LNLFLAVFNLLPIPPFDGSIILMGLSLRFYRLYQLQQISFFLLILIFMSGISGLLFGVAASIGVSYVRGLTSILP